ncbi:hypothetical protein, partial [Endozoicomonas sp. YOMI1]|uniref:hypothetical protein n=1 Tax=Endozoicomonas sp. YOMI1 TaxID=2828739 RepID=UPI0021478585
GEDYSELDGVTELFAESDSGESSALDGQKTDVSKSASSGGEVPIDSSTVTDGADQSDVDTGSIQTEAKPAEATSAGDDDSKLEGVAESIVDTESVQTEVESTEKSLVEEDYSELDGVTESFAESENSGDSAALDGQEKEVDIRARSGDEVTIDNSTPTDEADQSEADPEPIETEADTQSIQSEAKSTEKTSVEEDYTELDGVTELFAESEDAGDSAALDDNQETDVSVSERSGDKAPIDSVTTTGGDDQSDVGTESIQTEAESTEETSVEEDFSELDGVAAGIDDSEQSETALQRSDDSGSSQASIPEETVFTAESPDPLDPVSSDSDYFSDDESDQGTTQTLSPEPDLSTDVAKESASMERADVVRQSTANIREIAKRRKESLRAASASTTPSPAPSSPAPRPASGVINKPVDLSGVKSVVSAQTKAPRKTKSTDTIPKEERAIDKRKLGVSSTYNEASVIQNAFVKLQKNASNLEDSRDIAKTARKYISSEAQDSGPLLSHPNPQQKKVLSFLGLNSNASERQIRLALLDKAEQSAGSNGREKHENTMKALSIYCDALFNKR